MRTVGTVGTVGTVRMVVPVPVGTMGTVGMVLMSPFAALSFSCTSLRRSRDQQQLPGCSARGQGSSINHQRRTGGGPGVPQASPSERLTPPPPSSRAISSPLLRRTCSVSTNNRFRNKRRRLHSRQWTDHRLDMSHPQGEHRVLLLPEASSNHSVSLEQLRG